MLPRNTTRIARGYYWLTERLYNELAWIYDPVSWIVSLGQWDTVRKWALDDLVGRRVLEVGFGTGELLLEMARRDLRVVGMDPSAAMHRQTRKKLRRSGLKVPLIRGVAQRMPFAAGAFDSIIATYPARYIFDPSTWTEAARLLHLSPGAPMASRRGRFIVVGIGVSSEEKRFSSAAHYLFGPPLGDLLERFNELAQMAGLELHVSMRKHGSLEIPILIAETPTSR